MLISIPSDVKGCITQASREGNVPDPKINTNLISETALGILVCGTGQRLIDTDWKKGLSEYFT